MKPFARVESRIRRYRDMETKDDMWKILDGLDESLKSYESSKSATKGGAG